jgi:hypothetical protein
MGWLGRVGKEVTHRKWNKIALVGFRCLDSGRVGRTTMKRIMAGLCVFLTLIAFGRSQTPSKVEVKEPPPRVVITTAPERVVSHATDLRSALQPSAKAWIDQQAKVEEARPTPDVDALRAAIRQRFSGSLSRGKAGRPQGSGVQESGADVEAMVLIVLMEATEDNQSDLQSEMEQMQKENEQKQ